MPTGSVVSPYVLAGPEGRWEWLETTLNVTPKVTGQWVELDVSLPTNFVGSVYELGVEFTSASKWSGTCYVDSIYW
jgi:hypothetical protein